MTPRATACTTSSPAGAPWRSNDPTVSSTRRGARPQPTPCGSQAAAGPAGRPRLAHVQHAAAGRQVASGWLLGVLILVAAGLNVELEGPQYATEWLSFSLAMIALIRSVL